MRMHDGVNPQGALWRRAVQAFARALKPAQAADDDDSIFQVHAARARTDPRRVRDKSAADASLQTPRKPLP